MNLTQPSESETLGGVLNQLASKHYGVDITTLLRDPNQELAMQRYARLLGVLLKEPFAYEVPITVSHTGASIGLEWKSTDDVNALMNDSQLWQSVLLRNVATNFTGELRSPDVGSIIIGYSTEGMLGQAVLGFIRNWVCDDTEKDKIDRAVEDARKAGVVATSPWTAVASLQGVLTAMLAPHISAALLVAMQPLLGWIMLVLIISGRQAFCSYVATGGGKSIDAEDLNRQNSQQST